MRGRYLRNIAIAIGVIIGIAAYLTIHGLNLLDLEKDKKKVSLEVTDTKVVKESDESTIDEDTLKALKKKKKKDIKVGDLKIQPGEYIEDSNTERLGKDGKIEYTPWIDWSDNEVSPGELTDMLTFTEKLVKARISETNKFTSYKVKEKSSIEVKAEFPSPEELKSFKVPITYFAKDGILTINCKLTIYNLDTLKQKTLLVPVALKYDVDKLELINK